MKIETGHEKQLHVGKAPAKNKKNSIVRTVNVYSILQQSAEKWPTKPALIDNYGVLSYDELRETTELLRVKLQDLGVHSGMGLGVMAQNGRFFIMALFAGLGCGATVMPLSPQLKEREVVSLLEEVPLAVIVDDKTGNNPMAESALEFQIGALHARLSWTSVDRNTPFVPHLKNAAFVRFTSGTTGDAKGVVISHRSALQRVDAVQNVLALSPDDRIIWVLQMAYHFIVSILLYLRYGACIVICKEILARHIISCTNQFKGTLFYGAPLHFRMLAADQSGLVMPSLRYAISTSSAIPLQTINAFRKRFNMPITQAFGIIEVGLPIINISHRESHPDAVGQVIEGYKVEILDRNDQVLPPGKIGRLAVAGPGMFDGYLSPPTERAAVLRNGWFITGDLASKSEDGLIKIEGREKFVINVSGNKVFPEEVESVLNSHEAIKLSRVTRRMHPLMGESVHADVMVNDSHGVDNEDILRYCRKHLSFYKVPQSIQIVTSIATTGSGKVRRKG